VDEVALRRLGWYSLDFTPPPQTIRTVSGTSMAPPERSCIFASVYMNCPNAG